MQTPTTETTGPATGAAPRSGRPRTVAYWAVTLVMAYELASGSVWNLIPIEWIEAQLRHLGYPHHFAYLIGVWQVGAVAVVVAPRLALVKEWAYAGCFFLWSGAVVAHLVAGDGVRSWGVPLVFVLVGVASWALRPADRRLPETRLRHRETRTGDWEARPRAWAVPIGILAALYAVSFLTLPAMDDLTREWAVENGWTEE
ncbi:DoxX family protein [Glycomyces harbinensis]|uniref:DoxX-like family protein n=1 Tax=Glycomyces harbinensis TaxID=58114 RepID=A0A1G6QMP1_9ACTN|nr:DoxX family protein [Glycomyces harbinensis]SDC93670.1 DoxX-like family protein [Glycomyces harbinensis]